MFSSYVHYNFHVSTLCKTTYSVCKMCKQIQCIRACRVQTTQESLPRSFEVCLFTRKFSLAPQKSTAFYFYSLPQLCVRIFYYHHISMLPLLRRSSGVFWFSCKLIKSLFPFQSFVVSLHYFLMVFVVLLRIFAHVRSTKQICINYQLSVLVNVGLTDRPASAVLRLH